MAVYTQDDIDNFKKLTGIDIVDSFDQFISFIDSDYQNVVDYYSGTIDKPIAESFKNLEILQKEFRGILEAFSINKDNLRSTIYWEMLEQIEDINNRLKTIENTPKWLRSSIGKNNFNATINIDYTLKYGQRLEDVEKNILGSTNPENDWVQLAFDNDIKEEDYTINGGNRLKINLKNGKLFTIQSVVDTITEAINVYGKDIFRIITFEGDDLKVLSPKGTLLQSVDILANLKRGDNPEFPDDGLNDKLAVGSNIASIQFPSLFRQLYLTFGKDDSLRNFTLIDIKQFDDAVSFDFRVETRLDEVLYQNINI